MISNQQSVNAEEFIKASRHEKGVALIILITVLSFMMVIGLMLVTFTSSGSSISGNLRNQKEAFNAAEAGFDSTWTSIEDSFGEDLWVSFDNHYLTEPYGIDIPYSTHYFRKMTDQEILGYLDTDGDGNADVPNVLFFRQPYITDEGGDLDLRYTFTAFLIDDEAGGGPPDAGDAILVCIGTAGRGNRMTTTRLEVELAIELSGST